MTRNPLRLALVRRSPSDVSDEAAPDPGFLIFDEPYGETAPVERTPLFGLYVDTCGLIDGDSVAKPTACALGTPVSTDVGSESGRFDRPSLEREAASLNEPDSDEREGAAEATGATGDAEREGEPDSDEREGAAEATGATGDAEREGEPDSDEREGAAEATGDGDGTPTDGATTTASLPLVFGDVGGCLLSTPPVTEL